MSALPICNTCKRNTERDDNLTIPDALIASGNVIVVAGIEYAALEEVVRPVFSVMPVNFERHFDASFVKYKSSTSHKHDFTLVVGGASNALLVDLVASILPRVQNIVFFGPLTRDELDDLKDRCMTRNADGAPVRANFIHAIGFPCEGRLRIEDEASREYLVDAMKTALAAVTPYSI